MMLDGQRGREEKWLNSARKGHWGGRGMIFYGFYEENSSARKSGQSGHGARFF
jgi:hypothetical protein